MCDGNDTSNRQPCTMSENGAECENDGIGIHDNKCTRCARTHDSTESGNTYTQMDMIATFNVAMSVSA